MATLKMNECLWNIWPNNPQILLCCKRNLSMKQKPGYLEIQCMVVSIRLQMSQVII